MRDLSRPVLCLLLLLATGISIAQPYQQPSAVEIKNRLSKLGFLGSVLYVAAHPDDENTRIIAYLNNEVLAATAYLSMTRGDGGQNLIGPEMRDMLGVIRTQELLAARRIDGGSQYFTRANDFGYSKSPGETFDFWGKKAILSDVVKVFRQVQPDVIITRFPPDGGGGHGHHTASAILAVEAFDKSADKRYNPQQVDQYGVWQPKRLFVNTGRWWNKDINENTPGVVTVDIGAYSPLLGESYSEMAARSRSQHKSQGFGSAGSRGSRLEFLEIKKGKPAENDIFDGVNTTWSRLKGGEAVEALLEKANKAYDYKHPHLTVPILLEIRDKISMLKAGVWKHRKLEEVNRLIQDCSGLFVAARASDYYVAPGEDLNISFEVINRSPMAIELRRVQSSVLGMDTTLSATLTHNEGLTFKTTRPVPASQPYSDPYWLRKPHTQGIFPVPDKSFIGKPQNDPSISFTAKFTVGGKPYILQVPLDYQWTDPVKGERHRPVEITPPVFVNPSPPMLLFTNTKDQQVKVRVKSSSQSPVAGTVKLILPDGWKAQPADHAFSLTKKGGEVYHTFTVTPPQGEVTATIEAIAIVDGKTYDKGLNLIQYDHIPVQTLMPKSEMKAVRVDVKRSGSRIGYIHGAGDDIPATLRKLGYEVWEMGNDEVTPENLTQLDAVVLGIRALNTNERIRHLMPGLLAYVKQGGTLVVQYNTTRRLKAPMEEFAPYPLSLSRKRITDENSKLTILQPASPVFNHPNKITDADFDNWVQERGLYFPSEWDDHYEALLSGHDAGEDPLRGGLLVTTYGKGHYVYTGLSFFRELPQGVPGACKLFANLLSLGSQETTIDPK